MHTLSHNGRKLNGDEGPPAQPQHRHCQSRWQAPRRVPACTATSIMIARRASASCATGPGMMTMGPVFALNWQAHNPRPECPKMAETCFLQFV